MADKPTYEELESRVKDLEKKEKELSQIFSMSLDLVCIADIKTVTFIKVNPAFIEALGYSEEELLGKPFLEFVHSEDIDATRTVVEKKLQAGAKVINFENRYLCKDGSYRWLSWVSHPKIEQGVTYAVARDITERKEAEEALRERIKEMNAFYHLSSFVEKPDMVLDELYQEMANVLPQSWQYPEVTCARIVISGREFRSSNFAESRWHQTEIIRVNGSDVGRIEVGYIEEKPEQDEGPFLKEERMLIHAIAERIGHITERKRAEEALRESEKRYRSLFDSIRDAILVADTERNIINCNTAFCNLFGYTLDEIKGQKTRYVYKDDDEYEQMGRKLKKHMGDPNFLFTVHYKKRSGSIFPGETNVFYLLNDDGEITGFIGLIRDITERIQAEKQLKETRAMFQAAMDHSQAGIAIAEAPGGELLYVNESALNIRGADKEKIVNGIGIDQYVSSWQILHFDGTPYKIEEVPLTRAIWFGEYCTEEFIVKRPDQEVRIVWANAAPIKNDRGNIIYGIVVFLDVTERKKAELENTVSRMRLDISHRIATMPDSTEKDISDFVLEKMLELSGSDIGFIGYISPDEKEMIIHNWSSSAMAECAVHEKPITFPIDQAGIWGEAIRTREPIIINDYNEYHPSKHGYPEGHVHIARFMAVPVFDGDQIVAVSAVGNKPIAYQEHDPRQLMILMESWWKQIQKLRWEKDRQTLQAKMTQAQKMESIGSLAGGIAHDFNNILFPIIGYSQLIIDDFDPGSPEHESLKAIMDAGERGRDLVQQILAIGRQSEHHPIPVRIQTVLKEVLKLIRSTIPANIHITKDIRKDCGTVQADPTQIHQIAMNLITNASHALEDDVGEIAVKLKEVVLG